MRPFTTTIATLLSVATCVHAKDLSIYDDSKTYAYQGCYNETTNQEDSSGVRALDGGITDVREGEMTVELCLEICGDGDTEYRFAGLQWARECWCASTLAGIAKKVDDEECDMACEGDGEFACGGNLKLSVYETSENAAGGLRTVASLGLASVLLLHII
ncbi:WSC domain-containing protein [Emericellopsis atlantica]|uniref:WSC domain-containing protein n=1 Tax=Emericellopsis atlantica TaxID=2614577 RepID=A0A9P7ZE09_9HYPO|nr:WSC domain-containing protein [Emericellopsis atlantica]KAG9249830.1 WSC domain-containing protein [Emericellopsis atlantica]